jgi:hypothetical protein
MNNITLKKKYRAAIYKEPATEPDEKPVYRIRITAGNGQIFGHQYNTKAGAQKSLAAFLTAAALGAVDVIDMTKP